MHFAYFDESGDDGFPGNSDLFIMTSVCVDSSNWRYNFERIMTLRRFLREQFALPLKFEMHTHQFLLNKRPYRELGLSKEDRLEILKLYFKLVNTLPMFITNVCIDKRNIRQQNYEVLSNAFGYNLVRIAKTLRNPEVNPGGDRTFMIITDEGRVGKMRKIARRMQYDNKLPSKYHKDGYQFPLFSMIEDVMDKNSRDSQFIQLADLVGYFASLYIRRVSQPPIHWNSRMEKTLAPGDEERFLNLCLDSLNLKASKLKYGIVYYPKP